jgi:AcrR family transcriptional regulator
MTTEISRRERKKEETRSRIFRAAVDLFRKRGFESTTVDEITERADVAKGTFFNYFPRKEAVLSYLSESRLVPVEENAGAMLADPRPARDKLLDLYVSCASVYEEDRELSRYVLLELIAHSFEPTEEMGKRWQDQILPLVRQGQEKGDLRADAEAARVEALLTSIYYATLYEWACCVGEEFELRKELRARLRLAMEGVGS